MLASEILLAFTIRSRQMGRALALDIPHHFRYSVLRRNRKKYVNVSLPGKAGVVPWPLGMTLEISVTDSLVKKRHRNDNYAPE